MKMLVVALVLGTFPQGAAANEPDCGAIESTSGGLARHDAASPPTAIAPTSSEIIEVPT
ncbi:hypothetical protein [Bradyrhizobium sp. Y36]|uniref:hypothetical protein n=1 Tax=Bradyrhizobium sp. Y36 TaxID=2035447 RepID=UPI0013047981|nr:hypothetical protein [Bradyrhizobium sp. Y36]